MTTKKDDIQGGFCTGCGKRCPLDALECGLGYKLLAEAEEIADEGALSSKAGERGVHGSEAGDGHEHHGHHGGEHHHGRGGRPHGRGGHHGEHHAHGQPYGNESRRHERGCEANLNEDERLSRVFHHCARTLVHCERSQGGRASALGVLASHGAMTQAALAEKLDIRAASASELLAKMEADGLVDRTPDSNDARANRVELTEAGKAEARQIQQERKTRDAELFTALTSEEKQQLTALLDKLATSWRPRH